MYPLISQNLLPYLFLDQHRVRSSIPSYGAGLSLLSTQQQNYFRKHGQFPYVEQELNKKVKEYKTFPPEPTRNYHLTKDPEGPPFKKTTLNTQKPFIKFI